MKLLRALAFALSLIPTLVFAQNLKSQFIFQPGSTSFPQSHASTIVALKNGDLMAAWFGGTQERAPDVAIWLSRRHAGLWSAPVEIVRKPGIPTWNPVLFHTNDGRLWLYYKVGPSPSTWTGARLYSDDEGFTWSKPEPLPTGLLGPIRAKPLVLAGGIVLAGSSIEDNSAGANIGWNVFIERSTDDGRTFTRIGPITIPRELDAATTPSPASSAEKSPRKYVGIIQPSVVDFGNKHIRLYARSQTLAMKVVVADSLDNGITWTHAHPIDVPQNNSGLDVVRLKDGRLVMIYNPTTVARTPLSLAVSTDGDHFRPFATLEDTPGEYSYPAIIQSPAGDLEMTYTWKRQAIKYAHLSLSEVPRR